MTAARAAAGTLAAAVTLLLSACGGDGGGGTTTESGVKLVQEGKLTTCTHLPFPPFQFTQDGEVVGFDVALIDLVAEELGVEQEIVDTPFETIRTGADLNAGKCDVAAAGMTITPERQENLDFSDPYFDATQTLLAHKGSPISSLEDAKDVPFGSQSGTTGEDYVREQGIDSVSFESSEAVLNALRSKQVEVVVMDYPVVQEWLKDPANDGLEMVASLDTGEQYGFAVQKDANPELLATINEVLARAKQDGTYDKLYEQWIGERPET